VLPIISYRFAGSPVEKKACRFPKIAYTSIWLVLKSTNISIARPFRAVKIFLAIFAAIFTDLAKSKSDVLEPIFKNAKYFENWLIFYRILVHTARVDC